MNDIRTTRLQDHKKEKEKKATGPHQSRLGERRCLAEVKPTPSHNLASSMMVGVSAIG